MSIDDFVSVAVTSATSSPTRQGFGTPLIAAQNVPAGFVNRVRAYADEASMVADGFSVNDPAYIAAAAAFAQTPRPPKVKIGRRANKTTQSIKLKCLSATENDTYSIDVITPSGTKTTIMRTVPASSTTTAEATAIAALINAVTGFDASAVSDTITVTATAGVGVLNRFRNWTSNFTLTDASADPGLATDLNAILIEDGDWYGLTIDSASKAEILAAANWAESNKKLLVQHTSDGDVGDAVVSTDVMSQVKSAAYRYTGLLYNGNDTQGYSGTALQGLRFAGTPIPGNETWALKTLAGITVDKLSQTFIDQVNTKLGMVYVSVRGINVTQAGTGGNTGAGEWIDVVRFIDWQRDEIQVRNFGALTSNPKIPFTDFGIELIGAITQGALTDGEKNGGFEAGSTSVVVPKAADVDPTIRKQRKLSPVTFKGRLSGAIHSIVITGTVSA